MFQSLHVFPVFLIIYKEMRRLKTFAHYCISVYEWIKQIQHIMLIYDVIMF